MSESNVQALPLSAPTHNGNSGALGQCVVAVVAVMGAARECVNVLKTFVWAIVEIWSRVIHRLEQAIYNRGNSNEFQACPSWSAWSEWSSCSATCNNGITTRTRRCQGGTCDGPSEDTKPCNIAVRSFE